MTFDESVMATNFNSIINNIRQYISLTEKETEILIPYLEYREVDKKEYVLRAGEVCRYANFVISGCLRKFYIDPDGNEQVVDLLVEDHWGNDLHSFFDEIPAMYHIESLEKSELIQIAKHNLESIFETIPAFNKLYRVSYRNALIYQQKRIRQNQFDTAEQRYLNFRKKFPNIEQRISQKHVASYIGVTPQFLSVLRGRLAKE